MTFMELSAFPELRNPIMEHFNIRFAKINFAISPGTWFEPMEFMIEARRQLMADRRNRWNRIVELEEKSTCLLRPAIIYMLRFSFRLFIGMSSIYFIQDYRCTLYYTGTIYTIPFYRLKEKLLYDSSNVALCLRNN